MRARRALLYMPGDDRHKIEKALKLDVDCICMDLEDGVAETRKDEARQTVMSALHELDFGRSEKLVRINPPGSGLEQEDLKAALSFRPDAIVLPKIDTADQVRWAAGKLEAAERANDWQDSPVGLIVIIETPRAVMDLKEIAAEARLQALVFGAEDLAAGLGAVRTPEAWEVFYARSAVVNTAAAFGLQAIDMVAVDYSNLDALHQECLFGARMGYAGKQVIHPKQVAVVQQAFTPDEQSITQARRMLQTFAEYQREGRGAFALDGKMVDLPLVKAAQNILARALAGGRIKDV